MYFTEKPSDDKVSEIQQELKRLDANQLITFSPAKLAVKREIMKEMTRKHVYFFMCLFNPIC